MINFSLISHPDKSGIRNDGSLVVIPNGAAWGILKAGTSG